jgi:flagellar hook protein FlgE
MPSFYISLSGLQANSQALAVISNNLANLNTVGYKDQLAQFEDLFYQQIGSTGSGDPIQLGVGTQVAAISSLNTQGSIQSTGVPTDVAINGDGYFVLSNNGLLSYTRAGDFSLNSAGFLVASDGSQVLGNPAVAGVITPAQTPQPIQIPTGVTSPPSATANVGLTMNLDPSTAIGGTFNTSFTVHDAQGAVHVLSVTFTKTATNTWDYTMTIPGADVGQANPVTVQTGTLTFNGAGELLTPAANVTGITIANFADGAANLSFTWDLYNSSGTAQVTQVANPSAVSATSDDGFAAGTLQSFSINSDGTVEGVFSNGETQALGQVELASFANEEGLSRTGNNEYSATLGSGPASVGVPGTGGRGILSGGALEESNVDISTEFANLILAERGFQANAEAVTTLNQVLQTAINLTQ